MADKWRTVIYNKDHEKKSPARDNPKTFLKGCEELHKLFREFSKARPEFREKKFSKFSAIKSKVKEILKTEAKKNGRVQAWQKAAKSGDLFASGQESIPKYNEDLWHNERENLSRRKDSNNIPTLSVYRFYQAASVHRNYVLRDLLPSCGLVVT